MSAIFSHFIRTDHDSNDLPDSDDIDEQDPATGMKLMNDLIV